MSSHFDKDLWSFDVPLARTRFDRLLLNASGFRDCLLFTGRLSRSRGLRTVALFGGLLGSETVISRPVELEIGILIGEPVMVDASNELESIGVLTGVLHFSRSAIFRILTTLACLISI